MTQDGEETPLEIPELPVATTVAIPTDFSQYTHE